MKKNHEKNPKEILKKPLSDITFIIFDLEATGGNPLKSGLTEIYAQEFTPGRASNKTFYSLINPKRRIPPIVRKITQITNEMVKDAPEAESIMPDFFKFIEGKVLVSHNTPCDLKFIEHYSKKLRNKSLNNFFLCTHLLSEKLIPESESNSLKGLSKHIGIPETPNHRATEDTLCTLELFRHLLKKIEKKKINTLLEAIRFQGDLGSAIRIGWNIPAEETQKIPRSLGVLEFKKENKELLFSIASKNCKQTFKQLADLSSLPKGLARSLTQANKLIYKKQKNLLEGKLEAASCPFPKRSLFGFKGLEPSQILGLSISKKKNHLYEVGISHLKEKNLYFYGPLLDFRRSKALLDSLSNALFPEKKIKEGFQITQEELDLLLLVLNKHKLLYSFHSLKKNIRTLNVAGYFKMMKDFSFLEKELKPFRNLRDLRKESGLLFVKNSGVKENPSVYSIHHGLIRETLTIRTPYDTWLSTREGSNFVKAFLSKSSEKSLENKALTQKEATIANIVLWFIHTQTSRREKSDSCYLQKKDLVKYSLIKEKRAKKCKDTQKSSKL